MTTARRSSLRPTLPAVALALTLAASLAAITAAQVAAAKPVPQFDSSGAGHCLPGGAADTTYFVTAKGRWGHVDAQYRLSGSDWTALPGHPARMDVSNGRIAVRLADVPVDAQAISFQVMAVDRKGNPAGEQGWVTSGPFDCWSPAP
jgi:hypothetical protein